MSICARAARRGGVWGLAICLGLMSGGDAAAQSIVRIEEDWELKVATPDAQQVAPQVTVTISPRGGVMAEHATFEINHQSEPDFVAGGLKLHGRIGDESIVERRYHDEDVMSDESETVTWTQSMEIAPGVIRFAISNGSSTTWGEFGEGDSLRVALDTELKNLNAYDPAVSVENSGAGFAGNRVRSLVLKRIRYHTDDGQVVIDDVPRTVE